MERSGMGDGSLTARDEASGITVQGTTRRSVIAGTLTATVGGCLNRGGSTPTTTDTTTPDAATVTPTDTPESIREVVFETSFEDDPTGEWWGRGWSWAPDGGVNDDGSVSITQGSLASPPLRVTPQAYYAVEFDATTEADGFVSMYHTLPLAGKVGSDAYTSVLASRPLGTSQTYMVRGRVGHDETVIQFRPRGAAIELDRVSVTRVPTERVVEWSDAVIARAEPVAYDPPAGRFDPLPKTRQTIEQGGSLKIVILGDSIMNDLANGHPDVLLERAHPTVDVELVAPVRGGTSVGWFAKNERVENYVLSHDPDLVVAGGISTGRAHAYGALFDDLAGTPVECLALTGGVSNSVLFDQTDWSAFVEQVESIAAEHGAGFFDSTAAYEAYLDRTGIQRQALMRDPVHANSRGKAVLARLLTRFLSPSG